MKKINLQKLQTYGQHSFALSQAGTLFESYKDVL
jgi:hypothetical protein